MTNHFSYLYEDDEKDFFQDLAKEAAEAELPRANVPVVKTASAKSSNVNGFEKVASRLENDLFIVKTAGPSGICLGAVRRGLGHFDNIINQVDMDAEQAAELFDKVAAETIQHDLEIARAELYKLGGEEYSEWIDDEIRGAGLELVKAAELDKEALLGLARTFRAAKTGLEATKGLGFAARTKSVMGAPRRAWNARRVEVANAARDTAKVRLGKAEKQLEGVQAKAVAEQKKLSRLPAGLRAQVGPGITARSERAVQKATGQVEKRTGQLEKARTKHIDRKDIQQGKAPRSKQPKVEAEPTKPAAGTAPEPSAAAQQRDKLQRNQEMSEVERQRSAEQAGNAAKGTEAGGKGESRAAASEGAAGEGATLKGSYEKMRDQGWGSLSGAEKQKLINAGLATVVGHRVILGKGLVTGGEGLI